MTEETAMTLIDHLTELRKRIIISFVSIIIFSIIAYFFSEHLIGYLSQPVGDLVFLSPAEAFLTYIKVSILGGVIAALPIILFQFWKFILPALYQNEKKFFYIILPSSIIMFYLGVIFGFIIVMPLGMKFLLGFGNVDLEPLISLGFYFSFLLAFLLPFGLIFELPLVLNLLIKIGITSVDSLSSMRRYIIIIIFVIGAILTPPDVITQLMLALPLIILFEGSLLIAKLIN
ncbi:MAG: twin-arginine translocase subunit TatC [Bacillota bacterium]